MTSIFGSEITKILFLQKNVACNLLAFSHLNFVILCGNITHAQKRPFLCNFSKNQSVVICSYGNQAHMHTHTHTLTP